MNKNVAIILSIAAIFITATCVGATVINSDVDMKQNTFDGIKINVPHDTEFIQIPDGFKENTYGITIHTFKDNQSMVNFLNSLQDAKIVSLADQPPQSVAFTQGDTTNILVTNGKEGICVGASDQNLVLKMANSVIFSNGHPSERNHGVMGVGQKHLDKDKDFNLMVGLMIIVDNSEFNINLYNTAIAAMMSYVNVLYKQDKISKKYVKPLLQILNPVAPHVTEELWQKIGLEGYIFESKWPEYDESKMVADEIEIPVQVNGNVRYRITVPSDADEKTIEKVAKESPALANYLTGKEIKKVIVIKSKIVNIVIG